MSFTSYIFYFIIVMCTSIKKGNGASIEVLPGETVPPDSSTLTLKCMAASADITGVTGIYLYKDDPLMASITVGSPPQLGTGFDSIKYTVSGNMPDTDPLNFLQVEIANPDCSDGSTEYKCIISASNTGGPIIPNPEDIKTVTVQTSPSDLVFNVNPDNFIYFEDDLVTITCSGKVGDPAIPWMWERKLSGSIWEPYPDSGDITPGVLVPPSPGECSFSQDSVLTKELTSSEDGMTLRCLMNGVEVVSKDFTVYYGPSEVTFTPSTVDPVFEGDDMTSVTCNHDECNPYCEREWYKDDILVTTSNGILELQNVDRSQAGTYTCKVSNPAIPGSEMTQNIAVVVYYGPNSASLNPETIDPIIEGNDMTPVTCSYDDCNPSCDIEWYKDSSLVTTSNGILELQNVDRSQAGTYICQVSNPEIPNSEMIQSISLEVYYGPNSVSLNPETIDPIIEGNDTTPVTCSYDDCNPSCEIEWYKDSILVTNNSALELTNVDRLQAGTYICQASNPEIPSSEVTRGIALEVYYGPDFIHINSSKIVGLIEFEDLAPIPCWTHCNPECDIKWYNGSIDDENLMDTLTEEFELFNVSRSQQDIYYCEVSHPFSPKRLNDSIDLQVYYGPEFVQIIPDSIDSVAEGSLLQVICSADCNPLCQFTWYYQSVGNIKPATGNVLTFPNIDRNEAGLYICEVNQAEIVNSSSQTAEIEIQVHCLSSEIILTAEPPKDEYEEDESVSFTCRGDFSSGTNPSWKWQKSTGDSNNWVDYDDFTVSDPSDDGCSYQQDTVISITITADDDGLNIRCIKDENEELSQSFTISVRSNDKNGGCVNFAESIVILFSLMVLVLWM